MSRPPPLIVDPRAVPVVAVDAHLPPVPADRLRPAALRERFREPPGWQTEFPGDLGRSGHDMAAASVLVGLVQREAGLQVLLTLRTDALRDHPGQISFPGGRADPGDRDAAHTALRETQEEVGLRHGQAEVIGALPVYTTVTNFVVTPVVALVEATFVPRPNVDEVAEVFEVPLQFLMSPANHRRHRIELDGAQREFLSMPWRPAAGAADYFIWGATAAMLRNFYRFLQA